MAEKQAAKDNTCTYSHSESPGLLVQGCFVLVNKTRFCSRDIFHKTGDRFKKLSFVVYFFENQLRCCCF